MDCNTPLGQAFMQKKIEQRRSQRIYLEHIPFAKHKSISPLDFTPNDTLRISTDKNVKDAAIRRAIEWGAGSSSTRIITDHLMLQTQLQSNLARSMGQDRALFSPYQSLLGAIIEAFTHLDVAIFYDSALHTTTAFQLLEHFPTASTFTHGNIRQLSSQLALSNAQTKLVFCESISLTYGDASPLKEMHDTCKKNNALLVCDETYAFGMCGEKGYGLSANSGYADIVFAYAKPATGLQWHFIATSNSIYKYLELFSHRIEAITAIPPVTLGAIETAIEIIQSKEKERVVLHTLSRSLSLQLPQKGYTVHQTAHIITLRFKYEALFTSFFQFSLSHSMTLINAARRLSTDTHHVTICLNTSFSRDCMHNLLTILTSWSAPVVFQPI